MTRNVIKLMTGVTLCMRVTKMFQHVQSSGLSNLIFHRGESFHISRVIRVFQLISLLFRAADWRSFDSLFRIWRRDKQYCKRTASALDYSRYANVTWRKENLWLLRQKICIFANLSLSLSRCPSPPLLWRRFVDLFAEEETFSHPKISSVPKDPRSFRRTKIFQCVRQQSRARGKQFLEHHLAKIQSALKTFVERKRYF